MKKVSFHYDFRTEYVVAFLLAVIIILPVELPEHIAELVNNILGKVILIGISVSLFFYHPIVGALALVTIYQLLRRIDNKEGLVSNIPINDETLGTTFTPSKKKENSCKESIDTRTLEEQLIDDAVIPFDRCIENCGSDISSENAKQILSNTKNFYSII